jgi:transposase InsO family protein
MRLMGLEAIYAKPRLSLPAPGHKIYPYLLRDLTISRPDQAWCSDITFIRLRGGFIYLVAVMDWFSRYVRIPGQVVHLFRSKSSTNSDSSRPVIPIESVHRFRREADQFFSAVGIGGRHVGIVV